MSIALDLALEFAERIQGIGQVSASRFFGGAALKADGVQFGFVMKGSLYLRVDSEGRAAFEAIGAVPFQYSSSSKMVTVTSYYEVPADIMDDPDTLSLWAVRAHAAAPKPKRAAIKQALPRNVRGSA
ncbi:TfoX/Sxy family protein [Rhizobium leguminosarum]|uniref:TfoX/Sxy family protein n=1 Tax=Rhizobium leguminosarum TaxID=384 RepID=UPI0014417641|nr:TfoX/Sxy family protein [Rhizobium leguminosarum]MBY5868666.1 TfoX/Sxy family protein [Rhizobium leguminosarum]NKM08741.1 competence protein TfoX [Rhizobium leguminosarum bv. viciae]